MLHINRSDQPFSDQPFEVLRRTLALLTTGPGQPTLPTAAVTGVDRTELVASEVISLLRQGPREVADVLWHEVFARSRAGESTWTVIAAGTMLPRMVTACSRYARVPRQDIHDVESEMLTALLEQVRSIPRGVHDVGERLWSAVSATANRWSYRHTREARWSTRHTPDGLAQAVAPDGRGPVTVLAECVNAGVLNQVEADLVARTRLEHSTLTDVAQELGLTYITARRRRSSAEQRLAKALLTNRFSSPLSDIGT